MSNPEVSYGYSDINGISTDSRILYVYLEDEKKYHVHTRVAGITWNCFYEDLEVAEVAVIEDVKKEITAYKGICAAKGVELTYKGFQKYLFKKYPELNTNKAGINA